MNTNELFSLLKTHDLYPILAKSTPSDDNLDSVFIMAGALEDFISSAKAMNEKIIIVYAMVLEEEDFVYDGEPESLGESEADSSEDENQASGLDLTIVVPKLRDYRKYLGQEGFFELSLFYKNQIFKLFHQEKWWSEFQELKDSARDNITEQKELHLENLGKIRSARNRELVNKIHDLIKDAEFVRLSSRKDSTQRAMKTYALEKMPELEELDSEVLNSEIKGLYDKIKAQKILNKPSQG